MSSAHLHQVCLCVGLLLSVCKRSLDLSICATSVSHSPLRRTIQTTLYGFDVLLNGKKNTPDLIVQFVHASFFQCATCVSLTHPPPSLKTAQTCKSAPSTTATPAQTEPSSRPNTPSSTLACSTTSVLFPFSELCSNKRLMRAAPVFLTHTQLEQQTRALRPGRSELRRARPRRKAHAAKST